MPPFVANRREMQVRRGRENAHLQAQAFHARARARAGLV